MVGTRSGVNTDTPSAPSGDTAVARSLFNQPFAGNNEEIVQFQSETSSIATWTDEDVISYILTTVLGRSSSPTDIVAQAFKRHNVVCTRHIEEFLEMNMIHYTESKYLPAPLRKDLHKLANYIIVMKKKLHRSFDNNFWQKHTPDFYDLEEAWEASQIAKEVKMEASPPSDATRTKKPDDEVNAFKKTIKRDKNNYEPLTSDADWDMFQRKLVIQAHSEDIASCQFCSQTW